MKEKQISDLSKKVEELEKTVEKITTELKMVDFTSKRILINILERFMRYLPQDDGEDLREMYEVLVQKYKGK